jgi:arsenate reductase (thioredoxin)
MLLPFDGHSLRPNSNFRVLLLDRYAYRPAPRSNRPILRIRREYSSRQRESICRKAGQEHSNGLLWPDLLRSNGGTVTIAPHTLGDTMLKVIFACVHNAGRSQMAAAFFNQLADRTKAEAVSAGSEPGLRVHPEVLAVMQEIGIDLSAATPQKLTQELANDADLLITARNPSTTRTCSASCSPAIQSPSQPSRPPKYGQPFKHSAFVLDEDDEYKWLAPAVAARQDVSADGPRTLYDLRQLGFGRVAHLDPSWGRGLWRL